MKPPAWETGQLYRRGNVVDARLEGESQGIYKCVKRHLSTTAKGPTPFFARFFEEWVGRDYWRHLR